MELQDLNKQILTQNGRVDHEIEGVTYTIKLLPAKTASQVAKRVATTIAPLLGSLMDSDDPLGEEDLGTTLGLLFSKQLDELDIDWLADVLLQGAQVEGKPLKLDSLVGAQGLATLFELCEVSLRVNVFDFLSVWLERKGFKIPSLEEVKTKWGQIPSESSN